MSTDIVVFRETRAVPTGSSIDDFLRRLRQTTLVYQQGCGSGPRRAVATLLHGNEPSGVRALWQWLTSGEQPCGDTLFILGNVPAATAAPGFAWRHFEQERDMNRCFYPPFEDRQGRKCQEILRLLGEFEPACLIDIHNTSGAGPAFAVTTKDSPQHAALVTRFCEKMIVTDIRLGSLMEAGEAICPTVTIECGGAIDAYSDGIALQGLGAYLRAPDPLTVGAVDIPLEVLRDPVRVELNATYSIDYGRERGEASVVLRADVERFNFGIVESGECLGWLGPDGLRALRARLTDGRDVINEIFTVGADAELLTARALKLFMVTPNAVAARDDCLFYAVGADNESW